MIEDEEEGKNGLEEHPMMIENYKEKMADVIAMLAKQQEIREDAIALGIKPKEVETKAKEAVDQKQLDDVFAAYMDKEYKDEQIGDLDGDEGVDPLALIKGEEGDEPEFYDYGSELSDMPEDMKSSEQPMSNMDMLEQKIAMDQQVINGAVNEFIQDKKLWFRKLARQHGEDAIEQAIEKGK